jgi:hypothetical protein
MLAMVKLSILKWVLVHSFYDKNSVKISKGTTRSRNSKRDRQQHNGQNNKEKRTYNDLQNTTHQKFSNPNPTKTRSDLRCSGSVSSSCTTSDTRHVNLVTNPVISHEWSKDPELFTTSGTFPWSILTQIFHNWQLSHGGTRQIYLS